MEGPGGKAKMKTKGNKNKTQPSRATKNPNPLCILLKSPPQMEICVLPALPLKLGCPEDLMV